MASLFKRVSDVITANINDLIDRVEDPERMIKQLIREMEANIAQARDGVVEALASEKQLLKEVEAHRAQASSWAQKAVSAVRAEQEDLARAALARKKEHEQILKSLEPAHEAALSTSASLKAQLRALEAKLEEAKRKRATLLARQRAVEARQYIHETAERLRTGLETEADLARMEDRIGAMEARAAALDELSTEASALERRFAEMEVDTELDAELARIKREVLGSGDEA